MGKVEEANKWNRRVEMGIGIRHEMRKSLEGLQPRGEWREIWEKGGREYIY